MFGFSDKASPAAILTAIYQHQAVIEFDPDGTILTANALFLQLTGYQLSEIRGQQHRMFLDPSQAASAEYQQFWQQLRQGKAQTAEFKRLGKGGKEVWIQASYTPVLQREKVVRVIKFATDVSAEVLARADQQSQLSAIQRTEAVIEFSVDGVIQHANPNFLQLTGYQLADIRGQHHRIFVDPQEAKTDPNTRQRIEQELAAPTAFYDEIELHRRDCSSFWISVTSNPT